MSLEDGSRKITLSGEELGKVALSTIRAVLGTDRYQYLSGPITGGRLLLDWHTDVGRKLKEGEHAKQRKTAVMGPNIAAVQAAAALERAQGRLTIEPGSFEADFEQFSQDDFLRFWENVIEKHSDSVRFMDGWEFSSGCAFEYACARKHRRPTCDMSGRGLDPAAAITLLDKAIAEIRERFDPWDARDEPVVRLQAKIQKYRNEIAAL